MSDIKPSIDPIPVLLDPSERSPLDKSVAAGLVGLEYLARQAFEEKRRKQCLEVTSAILKIQPEHEEARTIQASVREDMEREFAYGLAIVREAENTNDPVLWGRAAAVFRKIVEVDPDNLEAQTLLHETVAASYFSGSTGEPGLPPSGWTFKRWSIVIGSAVVVILVAVIGITNGTSLLSAQLKPTTEAMKSDHQAQAPDTARPVPDVALNTPTVLPGNVIQASLKADLVDRAVHPPPAQPPRASTVVTTDAVAPVLMGALAVSAAVPVEIYRGEEHLGSTPTTLQLPAGLQTLEYRYQGLRQTVTHMIRGQETTTAAISFPVKVQINANPWARVFVDGATLTPIGQTPMGDVSVPLGSVLVFQNPGFPDKRYRVTARDATIQVTFP